MSLQGETNFWRQVEKHRDKLFTGVARGAGKKEARRNGNSADPFKASYVQPHRCLSFERDRTSSSGPNVESLPGNSSGNRHQFKYLRLFLLLQPLPSYMDRHSRHVSFFFRRTNELPRFCLARTADEGNEKLQ